MLDEGFSLITVGDSKKPNLKWKEQQTKQLSKEQFERNYNQETTNGVGYCTGFNNLEVFDIDLKILPTLKAQSDWWNEYHSFLRDNIADFDEKFVIYKTVNNGYHIIYKCAEIGGNQKIAKLKGYTEAIIETRGIGGYCFIYDKQVSELDYYNIQEISVKDREVLFECSRIYNYIEEKQPIEISKTEQKKTYSEGLKPWDDYNEKVGALDLIGDEFTIVRSLKSQYVIKRNGAESAHSGYVYNDSRCMYLFSTGTRYPHEQLLTPFHIYTIKYHNGDFSAAAKDLYHKGYGERFVPEITIEEPPTEKMKINEDDLQFPLEIFPESIANYIKQCNYTLNSSIDYMGCSMLWLCSVIIGNSLKIEVKKGWYENPTVWISLVGKPGIGKTPSINNIIRPLLKSNNREIKAFIKNYQKFEKFNSLEAKDKKHAEKVMKPKKTQFIANDITLEALVDLHEENKNAVGIFKDELSGWLKDMNKYRAGSDLEFWLSCWSGQSVSLNRKTAKSSFVDKPFIPVLGGIQPGILGSFYTEENKANGFMDRMLLSFPDLSVEQYNEKEMNPELIEWFDSFVLQFYDGIKKNVVQMNVEDEIEPHVAEWSEEAKTEWIRIYNELTSTQNDDAENEYMKSMLPKQKTYIPRFALLINTLRMFIDGRGDELLIIEKESILAAEKVSKYFIAMSKKIKVNNKEIHDLKTVINKQDGKSDFQKFYAMYKSKPDLNKKEAAELLGVSRQSIYNFIKQIKDQSK